MSLALMRTAQTPPTRRVGVTRLVGFSRCSAFGFDAPCLRAREMAAANHRRVTVPDGTTPADPRPPNTTPRWAEGAAPS
jgi:hypothetical protein